MLKQSIFLLLSCWLFASAFALQSTQVQQFFFIPKETYTLYPTSWHIADDIVTLYQAPDTSKGYLKISYQTSQVERVLVDTVASCRGQNNPALLDASYYHPTVGVLLYYCVANNSLLTIGQNYTVQDAIPISTSQTFKDVVLGSNDQGHVYILGLPDLLSLPAKTPTELILVDLKSKAVENHVIFNKGSDSKVFVTGYAVDSAGNSYIQTKGVEKSKTVIRISKIVLNGNDYELTPFANFNHGKNEYAAELYHNRLYTLGGYIFTNDDSSLLIFDQNGKVYQNKDELDFKGMSKKGGKLSIPRTALQISSSTFYAFVMKEKGLPEPQGYGYVYSVSSGTINSNLIDRSSDTMLIVLGGLSSQDLVLGLNDDTFNIRDAKTNTTLYSSFRSYKDIMVSDSHFGVLMEEDQLSVFDRKNPGRLPTLISANNYRALDKPNGKLINLSGGCKVVITDLETLKVTKGSALGSACSIIRFANLSDTAQPYLLTNPIDRSYYFVGPAIHSEAFWKTDDIHTAEGLVVPGDDSSSFNYVWNKWGYPNVVNIDSYKINDHSDTFGFKGSYALTTGQTQYETTKYLRLNSNLVLQSHSENVTIIDLASKTFKIYNVPKVTTSWSYDRNMEVLYDKNKTPYVFLSEIQPDFGDKVATPLLLDLTTGSVTTVPGSTNLTRVVKATGVCTYVLIDEVEEAIGVARLFDICKGNQKVEKVTM